MCIYSLLKLYMVDEVASQTILYIHMYIYIYIRAYPHKIISGQLAPAGLSGVLLDGVKGRFSSQDCPNPTSSTHTMSLMRHHHRLVWHATKPLPVSILASWPTYVPLLGSSRELPLYSYKTMTLCAGTILIIRMARSLIHKTPPVEKHDETC